MLTAGCGTQVASGPTPAPVATSSPSPSTSPHVSTGPSTPARPSTTSSPKSSSTSPALDSSASPFPTIIRRAMSHIPSSLPVRMAPTVLPIYNAGPNAMYYRPTVDSGYSVALSSPHHLLATFGVQATNLPPTLSVIPSGKNDGSVALTSHLSATQYSAPGGAGGPGPWAALTWNEGHWQIVVIQYGNTTEPISQAQHVVQLLNHYFLPIPDERGLLVDQIGQTTEPYGPQPGTTVQWQVGSDHRAHLETFDHVDHPLETAIRMAISFKTYQGG